MNAPYALQPGSSQHALLQHNGQTQQPCQPPRKQSVPTNQQQPTPKTSSHKQQTLVTPHLGQYEQSNHLQLASKHLSAYTSSTTRAQGSQLLTQKDSYFSKPNQPIKSNNCT